MMLRRLVGLIDGTCKPTYICTFLPDVFVSLDSALYYVKVMKKAIDKGIEYIKTEHERLGRILSMFP